MTISIVIPVFNKWEYTKKCLDSIKKSNDFHLISEVIVVDNHSTDETPKKLAQLGWVKVITNKENLGFADACNIGAKEAKSELVLFLNNDTEVLAPWVAPILDNFKKDKKLGAVGIKLLFPDRRIQHAGVAFFESRVPEHIYRLMDEKSSFVNKRREMQAVTAACVAIPKKLFFDLKCFDNNYKNGYEDIDLCLKIQEAGYKIIYEPNSYLIHYESVSPGRHKYTSENLDLFMKRWAGKIIPDAHKILKEDGFSKFRILLMDIKYMAYVPEKYQTVPEKILFLRKFYLLPQTVKSKSAQMKNDSGHILRRMKELGLVDSVKKISQRVFKNAK